MTNDTHKKRYQLTSNTLPKRTIESETKKQAMDLYALEAGCSSFEEFVKNMQDRITVIEVDQRSARQQRDDDKLKTGHVRLPGGFISSDAARALDTLIESEYAPSKAECISNALIDIVGGLKADRAL